MSNYEFWDELGKIFNAVTAYQEKTIEFNKRFINPWIRLGNVFDKQDRNKEAVSAYDQAIELDPSNPQNWYELGNLHFRMENYGEAINAFNTAIELDPTYGWSYSNLGLTFATQGKYVQAIPLYRKSIELFELDKDKAVSWNRLGNTYRKLNEYDLALEAFQRADDLDQEYGGVRDGLGEGTEWPGAPTASDTQEADLASTLTVSPIELILEGEHQEDTTADNFAEKVGMVEGFSEISIPPATTESADAEASIQTEPVTTPITQTLATEVSSEGDEPTSTGPTPDEPSETSPVLLEAIDSPITPEEIKPDIEPETIDTYEDGLTQSEETSLDPVSNNTRDVNEESTLLSKDLADDANAVEADPSEEESSSDEILQPEGNIVGGSEGSTEIPDIPLQAAYEQFLKDSQQPGEPLEIQMVEEEAGGNNAVRNQEPASNIVETEDIQIEFDTKNANVWNELGNVYFNKSAYDDAISAYTKAIDLDHLFAWPYSNLALTYVQKGRFAEAILLYQKSIELFTNDKDKAISWNRLGNVFRRLNDYENAISAYEKADELDPDNTTLSLQSRFSLLGSYSLEKNPSYVS